MKKPKLLIISYVLPIPGLSGQQQRVFYTLRALREYFDLTFLTCAKQNNITGLRNKLLDYCDDAIIIPSKYGNNHLDRFFFHLKSIPYILKTGLKFSNYLIGKVEFSPSRLLRFINVNEWDCVLFEYWHAVDSVVIFQNNGIPCVLDMHNVLWESLKRQLEVKIFFPQALKNWFVNKYRIHEEAAWNRFDALIAINENEYKYAKGRVTNDNKLFLTPMGTDLSLWYYAWQPVQPPRIAYYGGLGSLHNQTYAYDCYQRVMPIIWEKFPNTELWIVGSNPPEFIKALPKIDSRVVVTGYVQHIQEILKTISVLLCPWSGTYGFRSRLIEAMAIGIPVVTTPDAVSGMNLEKEQGIFLDADYINMARNIIYLLSDKKLLEQHSLLARHQIETKYSYEATYERLGLDLLNFIQMKRKENKN